MTVCESDELRRCFLGIVKRSLFKLYVRSVIGIHAGIASGGKATAKLFGLGFIETQVPQCAFLDGVNQWSVVPVAFGRNCSLEWGSEQQSVSRLVSGVVKPAG